MIINLHPAFAHIHTIAEAIEPVASNETNLGLLALANAFHNRLSQKEQSKNKMYEGDLILPPVADAGLSAAPDTVHLEMLALVAGVFAGVQGDPTLGATCFHLHDCVPAWSKQRHCVALLGRRFYYL